MRRVNWPLLVFIVLLTGVSLWFIWPQKPSNYLPGFIPWPESKGVRIQIGNTTFERVGQRLGLDLQGGTNIVLQADLSKVPADQRQEAMTSLVRNIERRVNAYGVAEPVIMQQGEDRVAVQLAGVRDVEEAKRLIGQTAQLNFKERTIGPDGLPQDKELGLTGADLRRAYAALEPTLNQPVVHFEFNDRGAEIFGEATTRLAPIRGQIAIYLDNELLTAPQVDEPILGGRGFIRGNFTMDSARTLAIQLNAGALPVPVSVILQQDVDATLGADSIQKSIVAGQIGILAVAAFMLVYYRLPGAIAVLALAIYAILTLAVFRLIPVTLTLAGIAGFILSVGMAVDANILIFERMREELRIGRTLAGAIDAGFSRAWLSIRDSNISTMITCVILYWFGSNFGASLVTGFALTLFIGVIISMFSAITVSRTFLQAVQALWFNGPLGPRARWLFGMDEAPPGRPSVDLPTGARPATR
ncbi:MAG: protein translocase subunit SecD [Chloroflexota bacterium]|nr:protein translocase subunit SecD [Dehalococcoidia bacterium]MDW8254848.1 protein translocase subunit SecD [Chloroflexota bacterium]